MQSIPLKQNYSIGIEPMTTRRFRLIVYKNGEEYVCRKENRKQLSDFLSADEAKAFKGRLQLFKHGESITVAVKGENMGTITADDLQNCINGPRD